MKPCRFVRQYHQRAAKRDGGELPKLGNDRGEQRQAHAWTAFLISESDTSRRDGFCGRAAKPSHFHAAI